MLEVQGEVEVVKSTIDNLSHNSDMTVGDLHTIALLINKSLDDVLQQNKFHIIDQGVSKSSLADDIGDNVFDYINLRLNKRES